MRPLDRVLPGRTTRRDLIGALEKRDIRLMLYYHLGPIEDPEWARATGLWETDSRRLFDNWQAIVGEVGERYGEKLAGYSWKNTSATEFQDFHCAEELVPDGANAFLNRDGSFGGTPVAGGDGRITWRSQSQVIRGPDGRFSCPSSPARRWAGP